MITVKITFGLGNSMTKDFPVGTTIGAILNNPQVRAGLGFGDNVRPLVDRVVQDRNTIAQHGMTIDLESAANSKATR